MSFDLRDLQVLFYTLALNLMVWEFGFRFVCEFWCFCILLWLDFELFMLIVVSQWFLVCLTLVSWLVCV